MSQSRYNNELKRQLKAWSKKKEQEVKKQVLKSAYLIEGRAKRLAPVFEGHLGASINVKPTKKGFAAQIGSGVLSGKPLLYAEIVEFGRKPGGFPPYQENTSLYRWVKLKLGIVGKMTKQVAFLIARKIAKYGFKPHPYLKPAYDHEIGPFEQAIKEIMK